MSVKKAQRVRAAGRASIPWNEQVKDPRHARGQRYEHHGLLALVAVAFACGRTVLRRMEDLSADLGRLARRSLEVPRRITDSTLYRVLAKQTPTGLRETVWAMVKELFEKKVFAHDLFRVGVASFDGKSTWTSSRHSIPGAKESTAGDSGKPFWSFASLRAVFTSSSARPCVDQELIAAKEGESPAFRVMFRRLAESFSRLFLIVTADAGMTCWENAQLVVDAGKHYLFALKGNQERLFAVAQQWLVPGAAPKRAYTSEDRNGVRVDRELYSLTVAEAPEMAFPGVQQVWCVRQLSFTANGPVEEVRYFLSSIPSKLLPPHEQLALVRLHWGIENNHNWTMDVMLGEDDRQPCQASRDSIEVVCWLRLIGYNLLAAWRSRGPTKDKLPQPWRRAMELLRDALVGALVPEGAPVPLV
jgi:hypothetical protein